MGHKPRPALPRLVCLYEVNLLKKNICIEELDVIDLDIGNQDSPTENVKVEVAMNREGINKTLRAKSIIEQSGYIVKEFPNGQLQVDTVNFWATSEKWYDTARNIKGQGIISYLTYLDSLKSEVITKSKEHKQVSNQDILVVDLTPKATKEDNTNIDSDDLPWY